MSGSELTEWERAYLRFQTPAQERRKFRRRLQRAGAATWNRDGRVLELFCGRGSSLQVLDALGFRQLIGIDLSVPLLQQYEGRAALCGGDCRMLPFAAGSVSVAIVQGGLHHLPRLPDDLEAVLREVRRVLGPGGVFVAVEPWRTPFLRFVLWCSGFRTLRKWGPLDAFATMVAIEQPVYGTWLDSATQIRRALDAHFDPITADASGGSLLYVGRAKPLAAPR